MPKRDYTNSNTGGPTPVFADPGEDRRLFDKMPKFVRLALIESKYDYNSAQVWDAFRASRADNPFQSEQAAWADVVMMIGFNDRDAGAKEHQQYVDLVSEFAQEKAERLDRIFQKAFQKAS